MELREFYCVFFSRFEGPRIVLLLSGYDKGKDPNEKRQGREIKMARKLLREHRAGERRKAQRR